MRKLTLGLVLLLVFGLILVLPACGGDEEDGEEQANEEISPEPSEEQVLNVYNWSTYIAPEIVPAFEEEYGVTVNYDIFGDNDELFAKIQPGNPGYDIIVPTDYMVAIMIEQGMLQELDRSKISNFDNIDPLFLDPPFDLGNVYCVPYQWGTTGLGYNVAATGREIDSWEVMFSGEFAGRISWLTDSRGVMGIALRYLGHDPNTTNQDEINEALELLLATKADVVAFAPDTGQILLDQGEVDIAYEYSGDIFQIMEENEDMRYIIPKEGSVLWTDNLCIPTGAPHPDMAHKFIDFILDAEIGAQLSNYTAYGTPNAASLPLVDEELRTNPGIYPPDSVKANLFYIESLGEADLLYDEAWTSLGVGQ